LSRGLIVPSSQRGAVVPRWSGWRRPRAHQLCSVLIASALILTGCGAVVSVEWSTETELNTAGFNLYRSDQPEGPFDLRVNDALIPASTEPLLGGEYRFTDRTARPGKSYYYLLEEVGLSGSRATHGPIPVRAALLRWEWAALVLALLVIGTSLIPRARRPRQGFSRPGRWKRKPTGDILGPPDSSGS
jgi:hypothetical protein